MCFHFSKNGTIASQIWLKEGGKLLKRKSEKRWDNLQLFSWDFGAKKKKKKKKKNSKKKKNKKKPTRARRKSQIISFFW